MREGERFPQEQAAELDISPQFDRETADLQVFSH
jgi:hypothetical protein